MLQPLTTGFVTHTHTIIRYYTAQPHVVGLVWKGSEGRTVLERAHQSPFFVQPVFREDGYFMLLSQFQKPAHFLLAYLEDYKMDPHSATPLLTCSIFDDYAADPQIDLALVRCDVVNRSIQDDEGRKIVDSVLRNYRDGYADVQTFNERPEHFMIDDFISRMEQRWNSDDDSDESSTKDGGDKTATGTASDSESTNDNNNNTDRRSSKVVEGRV